MIWMLRLLPFLLTLAVMPVGCGGGAPDAVPAAPAAAASTPAPDPGEPIVNSDWNLAAVKLPDPCTFLSADEVMSAIGRRDLGSGRLQSAPNGGMSCTFPIQAGGGASIALGVQSPESFHAVRAMLEREPQQPHRVPDLGDSAYFWDDRLYLIAGQRSVTVWVVVAGEPSRVSALSLARVVLSKLS